MNIDFGEIQCVACGFTKWSGFRVPPTQTDEVQHWCPQCGPSPATFRIKQRFPKNFWHPDAMPPEEFGHWLAILRREFPDHPYLKSFGVDWHPGSRDVAYEARLAEARVIGSYQGFTALIWNDSPDDQRILVRVSGNGGKAQFLLDPLQCHGSDLYAKEDTLVGDWLQSIRPDIDRAWQRLQSLMARKRAAWQARMHIS